MTTTPADHGAQLSSSGRHFAGRGTALPLVAIVVAVLAMLVGTALPASAATTPPAGRVTFGIEPAKASGPDGRPNFSFEMTPGAVLFDHAAVVNYSSTPLTLQLYATDAIETAGGGFGLLPATAKPTGVGVWISLPPSTSTVQVPAETATGPGDVVVPITVHVPASATPGDHVGGIIASLRTVGTNATGQTVVLNQRIGSRVFVRVAGTLSPQLIVTSLHASYAGTSDPFGKGKVHVSYTVDNTGNANLAVKDQQVSVSALLGGSHTVHLANLALLLPGAAVTQTAVVPGVWPALRLRQTVSLSPVAYAGSQTGLSPVTVSDTLWVLPWPLLVLILLILIAGGVLWARRRHRRTAAGTDVTGDGALEETSPREEVSA
jgi:hypothetical protein